MAIVTTVSGGERAGCLIGFHAQCSISPPRYVVWGCPGHPTPPPRPPPPGRPAATPPCRAAAPAGAVAVPSLGGDDEPLARLFGTVSGDDADKFARCTWEPGDGGVPVLTDCPNRFVAERVALLDEGSDHVCLVVAPTAVSARTPFRPLRLSQVEHLRPGHEAAERPKPAEERAG